MNNALVEMHDIVATCKKVEMECICAELGIRYIKGL